MSGAAVTFSALEQGDAWRAAPAEEHVNTVAGLVAAGPRVAATASGLPSSSDPASGPPVRIRIPRIGIAADVEDVGIDAQGRMATPTLPQDVGWYRGGPAPGDPGDAVIDGHLDWFSGAAAFHELSSIRPGDSIVVVTPSTTFTFNVDRVSTYGYTASVPNLFVNNGPPQLSLITCTGGWDAMRQTYLRRLVVHALLVKQSPNL